jgi:ubiquinone/menaquinone biosynthesis C-methylase UbiE
MSSTNSDKVFAGAVPQVYQKYLVPLIFEGYAADLVKRVASRPLTRVLEVAAGTGVVTRGLASSLPSSVSIVATDLNQAMMDQASAIGTSRPVEWRQADAMQLPFEDGAFDAVICQFGAMFFQEKQRAFSEARRVLRPGGVYIFNVWDGVDQNEFADVITAGLAAKYPADPPRFLPRTPYGYNDHATIRQDLGAGGFSAVPEIVTVTQRSRAKGALEPAIAYCHGTPLRNEIEARDASGLEQATKVAAEAVAKRFGQGPVDGKIQAHVITIER